MGKFCTRCGKRLEEGQICDCGREPAINIVAQNEASNNSTSKSVNNIFKGYLDIVKGLFLSPIDTIKKYATEDNFILGVIAMVINCLVSGLFFYFLMDRALLKIFGLASGGYSSLLSSNVSLPFGKIFLMGMLFMVIWFLVCAPIIFIFANPIMNDKLNIKEAYALTGVCSVFTTLTTLASILFLFITYKLSIIIILFGAAFYLTYLYQGLREITSIDKNKLAYVFVPSVGITTFIMMEIVPRLFS